MALIPILTFCTNCKVPTGDAQVHVQSIHNGQDPQNMIELELDYLLPLNGAGHTEKLIMEACTKLFWNLIGLKGFAQWCDFKTEKAALFLLNFSDHHKGWDFLYIILMSLAKEIAFEFVKVWRITKSILPKYNDLVNWLLKSGEVKNINLVRIFSYVNGPLLATLFLRCAVRTCNAEMYYAALDKSSLVCFLNNNINYESITTFELYLIRVAPKKVKDFIFRTIFHRIHKHTSSDCSAEGLDYRLEEINKKFKNNLFTDDPTYTDWIKAMSNASKMDDMINKANQDYGIRSDAQEPNAPDYESKIQVCRGKIRQLEFLDYDAKKVLEVMFLMWSR